MNKVVISFFLLITAISYSCKKDRYVQGKRIYEAYCVQCHMADGSGLGDLYPKLNQSPYLIDQKSDLVCLIRQGKQSGQLATVQMPQHKNLKEAELSNLINYLSFEWGDQKPMKITDIRQQMKECP